jgi:hypothetical protein
MTTMNIHEVITLLAFFCPLAYWFGQRDTNCDFTVSIAFFTFIGSVISGAVAITLRFIC